VPEGDTVWTTAHVLHKALAGHEITRSEFRVSRLAAADIKGWRVAEWVSRGKHLLLRLHQPTGKDWTLHSHLRMDGAWRVYAAGERWRGGPAHTIRVVVGTDKAVAVGYHLHDVELLPTTEEKRLVGHLGPDLLGDDWDPAEAVRRLATQPEREIGQALLDQRNLAGIGNLYKTELCFLQGIGPWTAVRDAGDLRALVERAHQLLHRNKHGPWQSTTGEQRRGREHWVFERSGRPCRRCGTRISSTIQGDAPYQRVSYWCPRCQPGPAPIGPAKVDHG
jgi:endonuclease-8